jgi:hypothetical protein
MNGYCMQSQQCYLLMPDILLAIYCYIILLYYIDILWWSECTFTCWLPHWLWFYWICYLMGACCAVLRTLSCFVVTSLALGLMDLPHGCLLCLCCAIVLLCGHSIGCEFGWCVCSQLSAVACPALALLLFVLVCLLLSF